MFSEAVKLLLCNTDFVCCGNIMMRLFRTLKEAKLISNCRKNHDKTTYSNMKIVNFEGLYFE